MLNTLDFSVLTAAPKTVTEEEKKILFQTISHIIQCAHVARREGLLALEEFAYALDEELFVNKFFKDAIILVCDGTDPDVLETLLSRDILIARPDSLDGYACYIAMRGILNVQMGENPYILREEMIHLLPVGIRTEARTHLEEVEESICSEVRERRLDEIPRLFPKHSPNPFLCVFNEKITSLSDEQIQRALREIPNQELCIVLSFTPTEIRNKIFNNVSRRLQGMFAEDMHYYEENELMQALHKVMCIFQVLEASGEV